MENIEVTYNKVEKNILGGDRVTYKITGLEEYEVKVTPSQHWKFHCILRNYVGGTGGDVYSIELEKVGRMLFVTLKNTNDSMDIKGYRIGCRGKIEIIEG